MERHKCLNLEPVTFVGTYAASLPLGNAESSRPAVLVHGGIFGDFLETFEKKIEKKVSKFFGDTLSRIVIDHKNDHPPPPLPPPHPQIKHLGRSRSHL